jgi:hypothetical protein
MKPSFAVIAFVSLVPIAATGCSKSGGSASGGGGAAASAEAPKGGSCLEDKAGLCTEYSDNPGGVAESACTMLMKGTYTKNACPRDNTIGSCQSKGDTTYYYFGNASGPWTEDAEADCKSTHEGTFTATAGAADLAKQKALPTPDRILASCSHDPTTSSCNDYYGDSVTLSLSKSLCTDDGTWNDGKACPTDGLVATCLSGGAAHRYYAPYLKKTGTSMNDLATLCKDSSIGYAHFYPGVASASGVGAPATPPKLASGKGRK